MSTDEEKAQDTASKPQNVTTFMHTSFNNDRDQSDDRILSSGREKLKKWLGRMVRVTLKNKLILIGIFSCTDHDQNIVIANCDTLLSVDQEPIAYGNVVVSGDQIESFEVDMPQEDRELTAEISSGAEQSEETN